MRPAFAPYRSNLTLKLPCLDFKIMCPVPTVSILHSSGLPSTSKLRNPRIIATMGRFWMVWGREQASCSMAVRRFTRAAGWSIGNTVWATSCIRVATATRENLLLARGRELGYFAGKMGRFMMASGSTIRRKALGRGKVCRATAMWGSGKTARVMDLECTCGAMGTDMRGSLEIVWSMGSATKGMPPGISIREISKWDKRTDMESISGPMGAATVASSKTARSRAKDCGSRARG